MPDQQPTAEARVCACREALEEWQRGQPPTVAADRDRAAPGKRVAPRDLALLFGLTLIWGLNLVLSKIGVSADPADPVHFRCGS